MYALFFLYTIVVTAAIDVLNYDLSEILVCYYGTVKTDEFTSFMFLHEQIK